MRKLDDVEKPKELQQLKKLSTAFEEIFTDNLEKNLLDNFNFSDWANDKIKWLETN